MKSSLIPNNSFYSFGDLQVHKLDNGKLFMALKGHAIKSASAFPIDVWLEESTQEDFVLAVKASDISDSISHIYYDMLLEDLKQVA